MKDLKRFNIAFAGLKLGEHVFEFDMNPSFFASFEQSEIKEGQINAEVVLVKHTTMLEFDFFIKGFTIFPCDRCGTLCEVPLESREKLIVKFRDRQASDTSDEIIYLSESAFEINLAQQLYEFTHLALPAKRLHTAGCDERAVELLARLSAGQADDRSIDPRWSQLEKLK